MKYLFRPYSLFLYVAILFKVVSVVYENDTQMVFIGGERYIIDDWSPLAMMAWCFLFFWLIYLVADKRLLNKVLTWVHTSGTLLILPALVFYQTFSKETGRYVKTYETAAVKGTTEYVQYVLPYSGLLFGAVFLLQGVFLYNIIAGIDKRSRP